MVLLTGISFMIISFVLILGGVDPTLAEHDDCEESLRDLGCHLEIFEIIYELEQIEADYDLEYVLAHCNATGPVTDDERRWSNGTHYMDNVNCQMEYIADNNGFSNKKPNCPEETLAPGETCQVYPHTINMDITGDGIGAVASPHVWDTGDGIGAWTGTAEGIEEQAISIIGAAISVAYASGVGLVIAFPVTYLITKRKNIPSRPYMVLILVALLLHYSITQIIRTVSHFSPMLFAIDKGELPYIVPPYISFLIPIIVLGIAGILLYRSSLIRKWLKK